MADAGAGAAGAEGDAVAPREVAHHDASRAAVSTTALGVSWLPAAFPSPFHLLDSVLAPFDANSPISGC